MYLPRHIRCKIIIKKRMWTLLFAHIQQNHTAAIFYSFLNTIKIIFFTKSYTPSMFRIINQVNYITQISCRRQIVNQIREKENPLNFNAHCFKNFINIRDISTVFRSLHRHLCPEQLLFFFRIT